MANQQNPRKTHPLVRLLRSRAAYDVSETDNKRIVHEKYDGFAGWFTSVAGVFTGHAALSKVIFNERTFSLAGCKTILDVGCGNGRYLHALRDYAEPDTMIVGMDFSLNMLRRAKTQLRDDAIGLARAELPRLPLPDSYFDAVVCGWVLEHMVDPRPSLRELGRVARPGGKILLMVTEDTIPGAISSKCYCCKTYNRQELKSICTSAGLTWGRELSWSNFHRTLGLGGIIVELHPAK